MTKEQEQKKGSTKDIEQRASSKASISGEEIIDLLGFPQEEALQNGPVAIIECPEEIPCNVCEAACPFGAIHIGREIKEMPEIDGEKCVGCAKCVSQCPGLAIYTLDLNYSEDEALLTIPYEFTPLPQPGDEVTAITRDGQRTVKVEVVGVQENENRTSLIRIAVPKGEVSKVRGIDLEG